MFYCIKSVCRVRTFIIILFPLSCVSCVRVRRPPGDPVAGSRRKPEGLEQSASEGLTEEEIDEGVEEGVQRGEEERALLQLKEEELEFTVEELPFGLAQGVRNTGEVERHEADKEHSQNQEHVSVHFSCRLLGLVGRCPGAGVGSVKFFGDQSVADDHRHQVAPENDLTHVVDHLMPHQPRCCLQVAALEEFRRWTFTRQDHVRQTEEEQDGPDGTGEELPTNQTSSVGSPERH